ncbi:50S ribosomal protein L35 [Fodinicola feengrottensis]|uniref:Large ribosomal subunit protein bL35 n=1 Tax=Fodinicola feengrottensis TaxID=435914 RepID=A0ABN2H9D4_9ACTN|nr:50S ribosomal protein L35 [Fodinicola feengrottensis]
MPKMKTHSGTKKRVRITGSGKLQREQTNRKHRLEVKSSKRSRKLAAIVDIAPADTKTIKRMLGR